MAHIPSFNNFFKNLLLKNQMANLDKTWQDCSLGEVWLGNFFVGKSFSYKGKKIHVINENENVHTCLKY